MDHILFEPLSVGDVTLSHRIAMTSLTRSRTDELLCPTSIHVKYYEQRATPGGLISSEATNIAPQSISSRRQPGIWTEAQVNAWKHVTDAVHRKGGFISCQLWHQGRNTHNSYNEHPLVKEANAKVCEAPSAIAGMAPLVTYDYQFGTGSEPHALTKSDIERVKQQFLDAADNALTKSGFDFVEIHGASGYLIDQFLNDSCNQRTDEYGGSIENRLRFMKELVELLTEKFPNKVAIRISPNIPEAILFGIKDSNPNVLYTEVFKALSQFNKLAYISIAEPVAGFFTPEERPIQHSFKLLENFHNVNTHTKLITAAGYAPKSAFEVFAKNNSAHRVHDAVGFGRWFISNPDLVYRLQHQLPLNTYNRNSFYTQPTQLPDGTIGFDEKTFDVGFTDYPTFEQIVKQKLGQNVEVNDLDQEDIKKLIDMTKDDAYPLISIENIGYTASTGQRAQQQQK